MDKRSEDHNCVKHIPRVLDIAKRTQIYDWVRIREGEMDKRSKDHNYVKRIPWVLDVAKQTQSYDLVRVGGGEKDRQMRDPKTVIVSNAFHGSLM